MNEPNEIFVATMHSSGGHANKNTGLQIAVSTDGETFHNIRGNDENPIYTPANGMRDPIVLYRLGQWYLAPVLHLQRQLREAGDLVRGFRRSGDDLDFAKDGDVDGLRSGRGQLGAVRPHH